MSNFASAIYPFGHYSYRRLWGSNLTSNMSQMMQMTLLVWFVLEQTDSPFLVSLVGTFSFAPTLFLGVFGGVLSDRIDRRRLLIGTQCVNLLATLIFAILLNTDLIRFWHAYIVVLIIGISWALDQPSRRSIIHDLLGDSFVTNGVALDQVGQHFSRMSGPAIAGGLIAWINVGGGYIVVTTLCIVSLTLVVSLKSDQFQKQEKISKEQKVPHSDVVFTQHEGYLTIVSYLYRDLVEGFKYVIGHKTLRATVLITLFMNLMFYPYMQMAPVIARDVLGVGPGLMGILMSAPGMAALLTAMAIASVSGLRYQGRVYLAGAVCAMTGLLLFSLSSVYALSFALMLILGLGAAGFGTMQSTIVMLIAPKEMRGRMLGIISLAIGCMFLGMIVTGIIADIVSPSFALGLNAVVGLILVLFTGISMPSLTQRINPRKMTQTDI